MESAETALLERLAAKYVWWKRPQEALRQPERIILQVMDIGDYDDVQAIVDLMGDAKLRRVIAAAEAGTLNERSWVYWHYRLGMAPPEKVPPLPKRRVGQ